MPARTWAACHIALPCSDSGCDRIFPRVMGHEMARRLFKTSSGSVWLHVQVREWLSVAQIGAVSMRLRGHPLRPELCSERPMRGTCISELHRGGPACPESTRPTYATEAHTHTHTPHTNHTLQIVGRKIACETPTISNPEQITATWSSDVKRQARAMPRPRQTWSFHAGHADKDHVFHGPGSVSLSRPLEPLMQ